MNSPRSRKIILYAAIALMVPTFIVAIFYRQQYPFLGSFLAICGIILLAVISFIDYRKKR
jgi:hypothetical protein